MDIFFYKCIYPVCCYMTMHFIYCIKYHISLNCVSNCFQPPLNRIYSYLGYIYCYVHSVKRIYKYALNLCQIKKDIQTHNQSLNIFYINVLSYPILQNLQQLCKIFLAKSHLFFAILIYDKAWNTHHLVLITKCRIM